MSLRRLWKTIRFPLKNILTSAEITLQMDSSYLTFKLIFIRQVCIIDSSCKKNTCHLQQRFFHIFESNKGTKVPENHGLD
jgi:hypothetical protein